MTIGAPIIEVNTLIGSKKYGSASCMTISQIIRNKAPINKLAEISTKCCCVLNRIRTRLGTANPTKAIGPQNAVTKPVKIAVIMMMMNRTFFILTPINLASWSPKTRIFNCFTSRKAPTIPIIANKIMSGNCTNSTFCKEPSAHNVKTFNSCASLADCINETNALINEPSISPTRSNAICVLTILEKNKITKPKRNAPIKAFKMIPNSEVKKGTPVIMLNATNKLDPELIPKTYGPASGLLNKVCINNPTTERLAPAINAIVNRGIRISLAIISLLKCSSKLVIACQKSFKEISICPTDK